MISLQPLACVEPAAALSVSAALSMPGASLGPLLPFAPGSPLAQERLQAPVRHTGSTASPTYGHRVSLPRSVSLLHSRPPKRLRHGSTQCASFVDCRISILWCPVDVQQTPSWLHAVTTSPFALRWGHEQLQRIPMPSASIREARGRLPRPLCASRAPSSPGSQCFAISLPLRVHMATVHRVDPCHSARCDSRP